jgi:hypothetical protein
MLYLSLFVQPFIRIRLTNLFLNVYSWHDESGVVQIVAIDSEDSSGLVVRLAYLRDYLTAHSLALICLGYQEKRLITGSTDGPGFHEVRTLHMFDGKNITSLHKMACKHINQ